MTSVVTMFPDEGLTERPYCALYWDMYRRSKPVRPHRVLPERKPAGNCHNLCKYSYISHEFCIYFGISHNLGICF